MTKLLATMTMSVAILLSGCASVTTSNTNASGQTASTTTVGTIHDVGMNLFKTAVDNRCRSELEQQNMWRVARVAMSAEQEEATKTKICSCVSEQAPQQVSLVDIANASIDTEYRAKLTTKVVTNSLQTCYANLTK